MLDALQDDVGALLPFDGTTPSWTWNQNRLPEPGVLTTPIRPPISSTSRFEIASPRPVPP